MRDKTHRFLFDHTDIRGNIATLEISYAEAMRHQQLPAPLAPLLGQFFAAVALLTESLKFEGILTLQVRGDGPVPLIMAEATETGNVRGIMKISEHIPVAGLSCDDSIQSLVGNGVLTLTIDPAKGERYQGIVPLEGNTLADCLAHYFQQSEQLPTRVWLFASHAACGGMMLQSLPPQKVTDLDQRAELWTTATQLAATISEQELFQLAHEDLLYRLFNELECRIFPSRQLQFKCSCTRARSENAIASLGADEAFELLEEQGKISIDCQFCGQHYAFKHDDLEKLFGSNGGRLH